MIPKAMDSLDFFEAVMALEEVLGIEVPRSFCIRIGTTYGSIRECGRSQMN